MEIGDLEGAVTEVYERGGIYDDNVVVWPTGLAQRNFGMDAVRRVPNLIGVGALGRINDRRIVAVRAGLPTFREEHVVGHELGHWILELRGYKGPLLELYCNYIGAALVLRRRPFLIAANSLTWEEIATEFCTTQTSVALRLGELQGRSMVVVTERTVYARGEWQQTPEAVRELVRTAHPGLHIVKLTDAAKRFAAEPMEEAA